MSMTAMQDRDPHVPGDVVLFDGGLFRQLCLGCGLASLWVESMACRVVVIPLVVWLTLLVLSAAQGLAFTGVRLPFLYDIQAHARFLLALPLLIVAQCVAQRVVTPTLGQFLARGIIGEGERERFNAILTSTARWNGSMAVQVLLLAFVLVVVHRIWLQHSVIQAATWYGEPMDAGLRLTLPGFWYVWVAIPLFQFMQIRWYYRLVLWGSLLLRVARLDLHLVPTHPDHAGGIGFLGSRMYAFHPLLLGQGVLLAGIFANRIFHEGGQLQAFWPDIAVSVAFAMLLVFGPLLVFLPRLIVARRQGQSEFTLLANRYVQEFERKWVRGGATATEALLGSPDIQSLADLESSYHSIKSMAPVPFSKQTFLHAVVAIALPVLPLLLTMLSVEELMRKLLHVIL